MARRKLRPVTGAAEIVMLRVDTSVERSWEEKRESMQRSKAATAAAIARDRRATYLPAVSKLCLVPARFDKLSLVDRVRPSQRENVTRDPGLQAVELCSSGLSRASGMGSDRVVQSHRTIARKITQRRL